VSERTVRERRGGRQVRTTSTTAPRGEVKVVPRQRAVAVRRSSEEWMGRPTCRISRLEVPLLWDTKAACCSLYPSTSSPSVASMATSVDTS